MRNKRVKTLILAFKISIILLVLVALSIYSIASFLLIGVSQIYIFTSLKILDLLV
jgi:hypothetical protein